MRLHLLLPLAALLVGCGGSAETIIAEVPLDASTDAPPVITADGSYTPDATSDDGSMSDDVSDGGAMDATSEAGGDVTVPPLDAGTMSDADSHDEDDESGGSTPDAHVGVDASCHHHHGEARIHHRRHRRSLTHFWR